LVQPKVWEVTASITSFPTYLLSSVEVMALAAYRRVMTYVICFLV